MARKRAARKRGRVGKGAKKATAAVKRATARRTRTGAKKGAAKELSSQKKNRYGKLGAPGSKRFGHGCTRP